MTDDASEPESADARAQVERAFPGLDRIEDDELREGVLRAWGVAVAGAGVDDLAAVPWFPSEQERLGLPDETLVEHVREVVDGSIALAEVLLSSRGDRIDLSMDHVVAGALVHDVSKLYEFDGTEETAVGRLLGHPHYGVHPVAAAGLPAEVLHVVLAHTDRTTVEPATLEAEIVRRVDEAAAAAIRARAVDDLRDA